MECINLRERFGKRFKVEFEESYYAERPEFRAAEAPWLMIVPCRFGHVFPWGTDRLAASTNRRGLVAQRLARLPFVTVVQDADDGITVTFTVQHFDEVARIMRAKRRRQLSESQRQAAAERLKAYQFPARQCSGAGLERMATAQCDSQAIPAELVNSSERVAEIGEHCL